MAKNKNRKTSVVMVDDQEFIREAFSRLLAIDATVNLIGVFSSGEEALDMIPVLKPDVASLDAKMPRVDGIQVSKRIREKYPDIGIILLTGYEDTEIIREFLKDDPRGKAFLLKHTLSTLAELIRTIHDVAVGRTVLDPIIVEKLTEQQSDPKGIFLQELTKREQEVLSLIAKAYTNNTIANILHIQPRTVEHHINSIFGKLGIASENRQHARVQAVLEYQKATGESRIG